MHGPLNSNRKHFPLSVMFLHSKGRELGTRKKEEGREDRENKGKASWTVLAAFYIHLSMKDNISRLKNGERKCRPDLHILNDGHTIYLTLMEAHGQLTTTIYSTNCANHPLMGKSLPHLAEMQHRALILALPLSTVTSLTASHYPLEYIFNSG